MKKYDIIILGAGAAGISCAMALAEYDKKVLILDKENKNSNDRTWCYWEQGAGRFDHLLHHSWDRLHFYANVSKEDMNLGSYKYKMIRSADFYTWGQAQIRENDNLAYKTEAVIDVIESKDGVQVNTEKASYKAELVLDSAFVSAEAKSHPHAVVQHFGGWFIKTKTDVFDSEVATLMDFRIDQAGDTRFFYVLPTSKREALVEIAIFSNDPMDMNGYDGLIREYIQEYLTKEEYEIIEKELGKIPMSTYPFHRDSSSRIIKIGTAGGWVKPSSGYAFSRIFSRSELLIHNLMKGKSFNTTSKLRHRWMDKVLLKAIDKKYVSGKDVFDSLFKKRPAEKIFRFLDEKNSITEDLLFMYSAPILPFTRAALGL